ncbi:MAG: hypothetical protein AAAFM81_05105 [Pseudomonadota bacterium]
MTHREHHGNDVAGMLEDYLNGHLSEHQRSLVEERLAVDPALAKQLAFHQRLQGALRAEAAAVEDATLSSTSERFRFDTMAAKIQAPRKARGMRFLWPALAACLLMLFLLPALQQSDIEMNEFETAFDSADQSVALHVLLRTPLSDVDRQALLDQLNLELRSVNQAGALLILAPKTSTESLDAAAAKLNTDPRVIAVKVVGEQ